MALTVSPGALQAIFAARCFECKRLAPIEQAVTKHGAAATLRNQQWDEHPRHGWLCVECRTIPKR